MTNRVLRQAALEALHGHERLLEKHFLANYALRHCTTTAPLQPSSFECQCSDVRGGKQWHAFIVIVNRDPERRVLLQKRYTRE